MVGKHKIVVLEPAQAFDPTLEKCVSCGDGPRVNEGLWCDPCLKVMQQEAIIQGLTQEQDALRALLRECRQEIETRHDLTDLLQRIDAAVMNELQVTP